MSDKKSPVTLKIILIGNSGVGKSSFMNRYVNHRFTNMYRATVGTDFLSKTVSIDRDTATLQIWDTAGTERFQSLGTPLYRGAHCCMLVFDVTSKASFSALDRWRKEFLIQGEPQDPSDFPFIVLGNKTDLSDREVSSRMALQWCEEIGAEYFEGSAKEDLDIEKPFESSSARLTTVQKTHIGKYRTFPDNLQTAERNSQHLRVLRGALVPVWEGKFRKTSALLMMTYLTRVQK